MTITRRALTLLSIPLLLAGCVAPDGDTDDLEVVQQGAAIPGMWAPPASTLAVGDQQTVRTEGPPRIADGGSCSSTNPWACSCSHPACSQGLPGTLEFAAFLRRQFPQIRSAGGFDCCRQNTGNTAYLSVHSIGRAIDLSIPEVGGDADNTAGDPVANWLIEHAQEIGVQLIVWDRAAWNPGRAPGGRLNPYTGPIPHTDHIHVELNLDGANRRTPFFTSGASTGGGACEARCDGDVIVNADCSTGDCGYYGVTCIADPAPRCVVPSCPPRGTGTICLDEGQIMNCRDGLPDGIGDCGAYGSWCSTAGVEPTAARCVLSLCVSGPTAIPEAHLKCSITTGRQLDCHADGSAAEIPCPDGQICSMSGGAAHCASPLAECPIPAEGAPWDDRVVCLPTGEVGRCFNGNVDSAEDCGPTATCSVAGGNPHCAQLACLGEGGAVLTRPTCTPGGDLGVCDSHGTFAQVQPCGVDETCVDDGTEARCVPGERPGDMSGGDLPPLADDNGTNNGTNDGDSNNDTNDGADPIDDGDTSGGDDGLPETTDRSPVVSGEGCQSLPGRSPGTEVVWALLLLGLFGARRFTGGARRHRPER